MDRNIITKADVAIPAELIARFAKAWEAWHELNASLKNIQDVKPERRNEWANKFVVERSKELEAMAALLNAQNPAGLVMVESWLTGRKRHAETLGELMHANEAVRFYREWMSNRGGELPKETPHIDFEYVNQIDNKFRRFIRYGYWTFGDEKYPDEAGYIAPEPE